MTRSQLGPFPTVPGCWASPSSTGAANEQAGASSQRARLHDLVRGATASAGFGSPDLLATIARVAVSAFAIVVAANQLGIATTLVNTLVMGIVAALALALGLAFELGGRDTAGEVVSTWRRKGQEAAPKMAQAAEAARDQAADSPDRAPERGATVRTVRPEHR
jgi:hypothetical protein